MPPPCVVVINDDPFVVWLMTQFLTDNGYQVSGAVGERDGYAAIVREHPALVLFNRTGADPDAEWHLLALTWHESPNYHHYVLPPPFSFDALRATMSQVLANIPGSPSARPSHNPPLP